MAKGVSIKFKSYKETIPKLLQIIKFDQEIKKHDNIILKPSLKNLATPNTSPEFTEAVLRFCLEHKTPESRVLIAEGSDGIDTEDVFEKLGYRQLAEEYSVGLIDLNSAEVEEVKDGEFLKFDKIMYPKILANSFVISMPKLAEDEDTEIQASLSNMLGAFPAEHYSGFFSLNKNKIKKWPSKYSIHDILKCKMPEFAIIDASDKGVILAGVPLDMDMQASKLLGKPWQSVQHLRLVNESFAGELALAQAPTAN